MAGQTIDALAHEVMARELQRDPAQFETPRQPPETRTERLDPEMLALLGGLADAGSTYAFLKRGSGTESNAMFGGLKTAQGPIPMAPRPAKALATAAGVAGASLGVKGIRALLRKAGKGGLADTLAGVQGANQIGLAGLNLLPRTNSSDQAYIEKVHGAITGRRK